jgi:hypothetical protein
MKAAATDPAVFSFTLPSSRTFRPLNVSRQFIPALMLKIPRKTIFSTKWNRSATDSLTPGFISPSI